MQSSQNLTRLLKNVLINSGNVVIVLSNEGLSFTAFKNNEVIDRLFVSIDHQNSIDSYKYFLKKYRKFHISIARDDSKCELIHKTVPVLQSIFEVNPAEQFIKEYYNSSDIIAYNIYNIDNKIEEIWSTLIVKAPCDQPLVNLINHIFDNSLRLTGIYYLLLEFISIIDKILILTNNIQFANFVQIFCYISRSNSIKFIVKYRNNTIASKSIPYPIDKSELYVQGIIEQEIDDYSIHFKKYVYENDTKICAIFLVNRVLHELLKKSSSETLQYICVATTDVSHIISEDLSESADDLINKLFLDNKNFLASNQNIRTINKMKRVHSVIFKPLNILIITLIIISSLTKLVIDENIKKYKILNNENYRILQEYRKIKLQFPTIDDVSDLVDFHTLTVMLKVPKITPIEFLRKFSYQSNENIRLDQIQWYCDSSNDLGRNIAPVEIKLSLKFIALNSSIEESLNKLNLYTKYLQEYFSEYSVSSKFENEQIMSFLDRVEIPLLLIFTHSGKL